MYNIDLGNYGELKEVNYLNDKKSKWSKEKDIVIKILEKAENEVDFKNLKDCIMALTSLSAFSNIFRFSTQSIAPFLVNIGK